MHTYGKLLYRVCHNACAVIIIYITVRRSTHAPYAGEKLPVWATIQLLTAETESLITCSQNLHHRFPLFIRATFKQQEEYNRQDLHYKHWQFFSGRGMYFW